MINQIKINNTLELIKIITKILADPGQENVGDLIDSCCITLDDWIMDSEEKEIYSDLLDQAILASENNQ